MPSKTVLSISALLLASITLAATAAAQEIPEQSQPPQIRLIGSVVDADTQLPIPARVYLQDAEGNWLYVRSTYQLGTAWPYSEQWVPMPQSVERHTTVSAHPFKIDLASGEYRQIQTAVTLDDVSQRRPSTSESDERFWLENMSIWHRYSLTEMSQVLGKTPDEIGELLRKYELDDDAPEAEMPADRLLVLPYPGGRHPRRGFLDGAIAPQRETKFSLFTPWSSESYIVADVPEAIFSNLGLIYLAHTHIPTVWDQQGKSLAMQEWQRLEDGVLKSQRELPNGIRFDVTIVPQPDHVRMELVLFNGTDQQLSDLRVQHCMMLAHAAEFQAGSNENKIFRGDYALVHDSERARWLITSWKPLGRAWGNPPVPCLHADPVLPDCPAGASTRAQGWLSFYEGTDWQAEIERIETLRWWEEH